jgi:hypothetical protein
LDCHDQWAKGRRVSIAGNLAGNFFAGNVGMPVRGIQNGEARRICTRDTDFHQCNPSNPILIPDAADLSVREIYFDHIFPMND